MVKNLRRLRTNRGISQQQLAGVVGTTQQSIYKYENQKVEPDIGMLIKLADYFGTTIDFLVGHEAVETELTPQETLELNRKEVMLIQAYRQLSSPEKESIHLICRNYLHNR